MAHSTLKLQPGVDVNKTPALNELAISASNCIRFLPDRSGVGLVQKLGGWRKFYESQLGTPIRALWAWEDTNGVNRLAVGAESLGAKAVSGKGDGVVATFNYAGGRIFTTGSPITVTGFTPEGYNGTFYVLESLEGRVSYYCDESEDVRTYGLIQTGDSLFSITKSSRVILTPRYSVSDAVPFVTTTEGSALCIIRDPQSSLLDGDTVFIKTHISAGGLVLFGTYEAKFVSSNEYSITAKNVLGYPTPATKTVSGSGAVPTFRFQINSPFVNVTLPDHGYQTGSSFPVLVPFYAGDVRFYGNYIVTVPDTASGKDEFVISSNNTLEPATLRAAPVSVQSDGSFATFGLQSDFGVTTGDTIVVTGAEQGYNGTYDVDAIIKDQQGIRVRVVSDKDWNAVSQLGSFFKSNGGDGAKASIAFSGDYRFNVGDTVTIENFSPPSWNGTAKVVGVGDNSVTIATTATEDIVDVGVLHPLEAVLNAGEASYQYYRTPGPVPSGSGYGVGGYGAGGYGIGEAATGEPATGVPVAANDWTLDNWGEYLIACPVGGGIYKWTPSAGTAQASIITNAPTANDGMFVAMPQRQIVAWGSTFNGIQDPLLVRWSDVSDFDTWVATITNQAGSYRISKGSRIVGGIQGPQQGLIWTDLAVWAMQYTGQPLVYQFTEIGTGCGLIGRKAAGSVNGSVFWMGQTNFFTLGGDGVVPIPCPVWDIVFQDLDTSNLDKIRFAANSTYSEVMWFYPTRSSGGEPAKYVKLNTTLLAWDYGEMARTAWINQSVYGPPIGAGADRFIYQHETSPDADGRPINAWFKTGYAQIQEGEYKVFVDQVWPDFKYGEAGGAPDADLLLTFYVTDYPGDEPRVYGPYNMNKSKQFLTPRFRGRLMAMKVESNDTASFWRTGALRYRFTIDGKF